MFHPHFSNTFLTMSAPPPKRIKLSDVIDLTTEDYEVKEFQKLCDAVVKADDAVVQEFMTDLQILENPL